MPSTSPAQHRWIAWQATSPAARAQSGMSNAKAQEWLHSDKGKPWERHDAGGDVGPDPNSVGGFTPSAKTANPMEQGMIQRYAAMPPEKLQELSAMLRGSPQGQIVQKLLNQKRVMPSSTGMAAGGMMSASEATPWWTRREATESTGFLHGSTPGRADKVKTQAPPDSYVFPADIVSGRGQGNSLAGAQFIMHKLNTGPYGIGLPKAPKGMGVPRAPAAFKEAHGGPVPIFPERNSGGMTDETPVALSHGELVASPAHSKLWGHGDVKRGHQTFDEWVKEWRKEDIKKLRKLPPPVGSKK